MKIPRIDPLITFSILALAGFSLSIILSTVPGLFTQQFFFFVIGFGLYLLISELDQRTLHSLAGLFYVFSLVFLLLSFFGPHVRGASRWVLGFQPSEIIKPFLIVSFSSWLNSHSPARLKYLLFSLVMILIPTIIVFKQPDLGNVLIFISFYLGLLVASGVNLWLMMGAGLVGALLIPFFWHILKDYQKLRIISFLNPYSDPQGTGYNALQAIIAIGSGGFLGLGFGHGTQSHLLFLPEFHTDFVFASLGEEFGFIGGFLVIFFFAVLFWRIILLAYRSRNNFVRLVSIGIFLQLLSQVFINIGMNLGLTPITGITLPLVSYGGSSIISTLIGLGFINSLSRGDNHEIPLVIR